jgi:hypothetical protein
MPTLEIPERYVAAIHKILRLDVKAVEEIRSNLERENQPGVGQNDIRSMVSRSVSDPEIAEGLVSLYVVKSSRELPTEELAEAVCAAAERQVLDKKPFTQAERIHSKENLVKLLSVGRIALLSKALDLQTSDERSFCDVRILTDLRPVFGPTISEGPKGMVIVHHLRLAYHRPGSPRHENFYVSLDADDLKMLHKVIERAEQKANALRDTANKFPYMGY